VGFSISRLSSGCRKLQVCPINTDLAVLFWFMKIRTGHSHTVIDLAIGSRARSRILESARMTAEASSGNLFTKGKDVHIIKNIRRKDHIKPFTCCALKILAHCDFDLVDSALALTASRETGSMSQARTFRAPRAPRQQRQFLTRSQNQEQSGRSRVLFAP